MKALNAYQNRPKWLISKDLSIRQNLVANNFSRSSRIRPRHKLAIVLNLPILTRHRGDHIWDLDFYWTRYLSDSNSNAEAIETQSAQRKTLYFASLRSLRLCGLCVFIFIQPSPYDALPRENRFPHPRGHDRVAIDEWQKKAEVFLGAAEVIAQGRSPGFTVRAQRILKMTDLKCFDRHINRKQVLQQVG